MKKVKKKLLALLMAAVMVFSLAACSNGGEAVEDENLEPIIVTATPTPTPVPTTAPAAVVVDKGPASVDFEDGVYDFVNVYLKHATSDESVISIAEFNGSNALKVETTNQAKYPWIAIDVYALCHTMEKTVTVMTAGIAFISMMRKYVYHMPAPSTNAASSISLGSPLKNWLKM